MRMSSCRSWLWFSGAIPVKKAEESKILFTSNSVVHGPMTSFIHIIALSLHSIWILKVTLLLDWDIYLCCILAYILSFKVTLCSSLLLLFRLILPLLFLFLIWYSYNESCQSFLEDFVLSLLSFVSSEENVLAYESIWFQLRERWQRRTTHGIEPLAQQPQPTILFSIHMQHVLKVSMHTSMIFICFNF